MNKFWFIIPPLILIVAITGCVSSKAVGECRTNRDEYSCSGSISNDEITLTLSPMISGATLSGAHLSTCEITGSLWSCKGSTECEIISALHPFKVRCPVSSGAYSVSFKLTKIIEQGQQSNEPLVGNCASTSDGKFNCELVVSPTYYFKI